MCLGEAPWEEEVLACLGKFFLWRRQASAQAEQTTYEGRFWLLCGGIPTTAMVSFRLQPTTDWPAGIYYTTTAPALQFGLVVLAELLRDRSTLLLRLLGAGSVLHEAMKGLAALPTAVHFSCWLTR